MIHTGSPILVPYDIPYLRLFYVAYALPYQLDRLEKELDLATCHVRSLKNAEHGINALAPEILGQIFASLDSLRAMGNQADLHHASSQKSRALLTIMHVCRQWRSVTLTTPNLWNHIHVRQAPHPLVSLSFTSSGHLPLTIYYTEDWTRTTETTDESEAVRVIAEHINRVVDLIMYIPWPANSPKARNWTILDREAPMLNAIQIIWVASSRRPESGSIVLPRLFADWHPQLERVTLCNYTPSPESQLRDLRSLVLHHQSLIQHTRPGFCHFLPVIAESPRLEELIVDCEGSVSDLRSPPDGRFLDNPVSLPHLRILALGLCSRWRAETTGDAATFLSCLRMPDRTSRYLFTMDDCEWELSLSDLMDRGRLQPSMPRFIRKLQMVSSKDLDWWRAFALEDHTLTITTKLDVDIRATMITSGVLSGVEDLVLVLLPPYPCLLELKSLFESLPSLRHIAVSGPIRGSVLLSNVTNALGLRPSRHPSVVSAGDGSLSNFLLESLSFLYYDPSRLPQTEDDDIQVDGTMVALLAEERARRGVPLRQVVIERCRDEHLGWIQEHVTSVASIKRWEGYPGDYHEKLILKKMLARVQPQQLRSMY